MAKTIAKAHSEDNSGRVNKWLSTPGGKSATAQANTWETFTEAHVFADGSGYVEVRRARDGAVCRIRFTAESEPGASEFYVEKSGPADVRRAQWGA